jgi:F-type H+-transporting ATPase subunit b
MHIDWFVLFCQIVNFLILIFLLKHFLYGRILNAMDAREARLIAGHAEADRLKAEALASAQAYDTKYQTLLANSEEMMNQAHLAAENTKKDLMSKARGEVDATQKRWYETLAREKTSFLEDLRRRAGAHIYDTIRRVMHDLADAELEERIIIIFLKLLKTSPSERLQDIRANLAQADPEEGVIIRSGFPLSTSQQDRIIAALEAYAPQETPIRFETSTEIITGIEMLSHGHKVSWSVGDYLSELEEAFHKILKEEIPPAELT